MYPKKSASKIKINSGFYSSFDGNFMKEGNKSYKKTKVESFLEYNNGRVNAITGFK